MISQTEICVIATLRILYSIRKYCILVKKKKEIDIDRVKKFCLHVFTSNIRLKLLIGSLSNYDDDYNDNFKKQ